MSTEEVSWSGPNKKPAHGEVSGLAEDELTYLLREAH